MEEARRMTEALTKRFGSSDPRDLITSKERLTSPAATNAEPAQRHKLQHLVGRR